MELLTRHEVKYIYRTDRLLLRSSRAVLFFQKTDDLRLVVGSNSKFSGLCDPHTQSQSDVVSARYDWIWDFDSP